MTELHRIKHKDLRDAVQAAINVGFTLAERKGNGHGHVLWPATGQKVGFADTPSEYRGTKNFVARCENISGKRLFARHKTGKAATKVTRNGYIDTQLTESSQRWSETISEMRQEYIDKGLEFRVLCSADVDHNDIKLAIRLLHRLSRIQETFAELRQPLPDIGLPNVTEDFFDYQQRKAIK